MKIELTELEYVLLKMFQTLSEEEKTTVLASAEDLRSGRSASLSPDPIAV